jgi:hypothetical protein
LPASSVHFLTVPADKAAASLEQASGRLYAVLDGAKDAEIVPWVHAQAARHESLFSGKSAELMVDHAPYLLELTRRADVQKDLLARAGGKSWGIFVQSEGEFEALRSQLRRLTMVELPGGDVVLFRFYDPRVLRTFLPTCDAAQAAWVFAGVGMYLVESAEGLAVFSIPRGRAAHAAMPTLRMRIRADQVVVLEGLVRRDLESRLVAFARETFDGAQRKIADAALPGAIHEAIDRGDGLEIRSEAGLMHYVGLLVMTGQWPERIPGVQAWLDHPQALTRERKLEMLFQRVAYGEVVNTEAPL